MVNNHSVFDSSCCKQTRGVLTTRLKFILLIAVLLCSRPLLAADNGEVIDFPSSSLLEGYVLSSVIWPHAADGTTRIPVCWERNRFSNFQRDEREWVRRAVNRTWEANSLVRFTGWGYCRSGSRGIRVGVVDKVPRVLALGSALDGRRHGMHLNFTFRNWGEDCKTSKQFCIEAIAVHEFGHALGFAHEQNRPDTNLVCARDYQGTSGNMLVGPWDLDSIMNYCNPNWNNAGLLSDIDIYMVKSIYGNAPEYNTLTQSVHLPVVMVNGVKYSGALSKVGSEWEVSYIQPTNQLSSAISSFSLNTLKVPFVALFNGTNIEAFYRASMELQSNGRYRLTSLIPLHQ